MTSFDLHLEHERNLEIVNAHDIILENEQDKKIKLTYSEAIQEIYKLALDPEYEKYFYKFNNISSIDKNSMFLGAAINKIIGKIFLFLKEKNNISILEWTQDNNWCLNHTLHIIRTPRTTIHDNYICSIVGHSYINEKRYSLKKITQENTRKEFYFFTGSLGDKSSYYLPINLISSVDLKDFDDNTLSFGGFMINTEDLENRFSFFNVKNARNKINLESS